MQATPSFTGRRRRRTTRRGVRAVDLLARSLITVGGIGTIVAVGAVCIFLAGVVLPLFWPASVTPIADFEVPADIETPLHLAVDEHQVLGWSLAADGTLHSFQLDPPQSLPPRRLFEERKITAVSFPIGDETASIGFDDGTLRLGRLRVVTRFLSTDDVPEDLRSSVAGAQTTVYEGGVLARSGEDQYRLQTLTAEFDEPIDLDPEATSSIIEIDHVERGGGPLLAVLTADGKLRVQSIIERKNLLTGEEKTTIKGSLLPLPDGHAALPEHVLVSGSGDNVFVLWKDGRLARFDVRNLEEPKLVEQVDVVDDPSASLTAATFMLGRSTLITGDSNGRVRAWFRAFPSAAEDAVELATAPGLTTTVDLADSLVCGHDFPPLGAAVTSLSASTRTRILAIGLADGRTRLLHVTSEKPLGEVSVTSEAPVATLALSPRDDGLLALVSDRLWQWRVDAPHPEVTLAALFLPVWYEGYDRPMHIWQSSAATQESEPKLGLWPLVFGTIKATFYSMLFGAPLALMAAIYTSEFLHARIKSKIKPVIELMASLPSVVLGFLAALIFAPIIGKVVPVVLASFVIVPATFLLGAYCWQLLPYRLNLILSKWRFVFIALSFPLGLVISFLLGPLVERLLFAGDILAWLDGQRGSGAGGWMLLLLPLCCVGAFILGREVNTWLRRISIHWTRTQCALVDLVKFVLVTAAALAVAWMISASLSAAGFDPRGSFVDTYDQRNALIVGFVMGFAIIPLIYTIAEDALSTVPGHLRSASLGAGATPWQTATRIVIPTAMSGLFSALMIGLGRAVGETMIVLMAAGNTPLRDWNIFNGFRTLSANIAVELPEAPVDGTHYRTLFLAALCLFILTFAVNTVAELVRLRFRRRAYEL